MTTATAARPSAPSPPAEGSHGSRSRRSLGSRGVPDYELRLSGRQAAFVEDQHRYVLFVGGVGAGKSYAGAARAIPRFSVRGRPQLGLVVAPTYPMLRDATLRTALEVWAPWVRSVVASEMRVVLANGHEVLFRSADEPDRLRGPNVAWAWLDEAAMCHPDTWPITIGRLRQHGTPGDAWLTTTPRGMNWVYETFIVHASSETAIHRAATWENPFIDEAFAASLLGQYDGPFARQEIDAEFVADQEGALLEYRWLEAAAARPASYDPKGGPVVAGVDVAGPGEDETVVVVRQGGQILGTHAFPDPDARGAVLAALRPWRHRGLDRVVVDTAGIGHYAARALEDAGLRVRDLNVGERPTSDAAAERYANLKAECYWSLRERFADGDIAGLADRTMLAQLASLRYSHDARGRVVIEPKEKARARGVRSPDRAEALMLAFCPEDPAELRAALYGLTNGGASPRSARPLHVRSGGRA